MSEQTPISATYNESTLLIDEGFCINETNLSPEKLTEESSELEFRTLRENLYLFQRSLLELKTEMLKQTRKKEHFQFKIENHSPLWPFFVRNLAFQALGLLHKVRETIKTKSFDLDLEPAFITHLKNTIKPCFEELESHYKTLKVSDAPTKEKEIVGIITYLNLNLARIQNIEKTFESQKTTSKEIDTLLMHPKRDPAIFRPKR